jgi:hypothetical protein
MMGHAYSLDERLIRVPCAAAGPGSDRVGEISSLATLPAAIARAVELDGHPWVDPSPDGIAVAQFDAPVDPGDPRAHRALEAWGLGEEALPRITTDFACATDGRYKLIRREPAGSIQEEVLDLRSDPLEAHPLGVDSVPDPDVIERLRAALEASVEGGVAPAPPDDAVEIPPEEREALEQRMQLLGYM